MTELIHFRFLGARRWDGGDDFPSGVPCPRVPSVGEIVTMPDDGEAWRVVRVEYRYEDGLAFKPIVVVICESVSGGTPDE